MLEVMIASAISVIVLMILYGLFVTSSDSYVIHTKHRSAHFDAQKALNMIVRDLKEAKQKYAWTSPVTGEFTSVELTQLPAVVFLSARHVTSMDYIVDASLMPIWQKTVAYVPLRDPTGQVNLYRFTWTTGAVPPDPLNSTAVITADANNIHLQYMSGGAPVFATPIALARGLGVRQLEGLKVLYVNNPSKTTSTADDWTVKDSGGGDMTYAPDVWTVAITIDVGEFDANEVETTVTTTVTGRAQ
jgi:hypothetical protein